MISRVSRPYRRQSAHLSARISQGLEPARNWGSVSVASGVPGVGAGADHLFRTPYLGGQVDAQSSNPPAFFPGRGGRAKRARGASHTRHFAETPLLDVFFLRCTGNSASLHPSEPTKKQGWAGCEQNGFGRLWPSVQAWPLAATQSNNKRSMAQVPGWARRWCWMETRSPAWRWERRPTRFIARSARPTATDRARRLGAVPVCLNTRNSTVPGHRTRGGALRFPIPKTKD